MFPYHSGTHDTHLFRDLTFRFKRFVIPGVPKKFELYEFIRTVFFFFQLSVHEFPLDNSIAEPWSRYFYFYLCCGISPDYNCTT